MYEDLGSMSSTIKMNNNQSKTGKEACAFNPRRQKQTDLSQGQPGLLIKFQASQGYNETLSKNQTDEQTNQMGSIHFF